MSTPATDRAEPRPVSSGAAMSTTGKPNSSTSWLATMPMTPLCQSVMAEHERRHNPAARALFRFGRSPIGRPGSTRTCASGIQALQRMRQICAPGPSLRSSASSTAGIGIREPPQRIQTRAQARSRYGSSLSSAAGICGPFQNRLQAPAADSPAGAPEPRCKRIARIVGTCTMTSATMPRATRSRAARRSVLAPR